MSSSASTQQSKIGRIAGKMYYPLGFQHGYSFVCFVIFGGALTGFTLARLQFLAFNQVFCKPLNLVGAGPGECYWYHQQPYKTGILLHLGAILPCALLVIFQFIPAIRHKFVVFHRLNGYIIITLTLTSNAGAVIIARRAFGGTVATQTLVGLLVLMSTFAIFNAYYNIRRLQMDQHRAWMLRTFAWMAAIVTARIVVQCMIHIISVLIRGYDFWDQRSCAELISIAGAAPVYYFYPACEPSNQNFTTDGRVVMRATWNSQNPFEKVAVAGISFPAAIWLSLALHVVGVELYLAWTPKEANRLRKLSFERQLARGFKKTAQISGDMDNELSEGGNYVKGNISDGHGLGNDLENDAIHTKSTALTVTTKYVPKPAVIYLEPAEPRFSLNF